MCLENVCRGLEDVAVCEFGQGRWILGGVEKMAAVAGLVVVVMVGREKIKGLAREGKF